MNALRTKPVQKMDCGPQQPSQEELLELSLRPGTNVDLVLERDENREVALVKRSLVYDIRGELLALAQVEPALGKANLGELMEVTFLVRHYVEGLGPEWLRTGYVAKLQEVAPNFPLGGGRSEPALIFPVPKRLDLTTVRMHHRVAPPLKYQFKAAMLEGSRPKVLAEVSDLSLSGALLVHDPKWETGHKRQVRLQLTWEGGELEVRAEVVRQSKTEQGRGRAKGITAVKFCFEDSNQRRVLSGLMAVLQRWEMARRACLDEP